MPHPRRLRVTKSWAGAGALPRAGAAAIPAPVFPL